VAKRSMKKRAAIIGIVLGLIVSGRRVFEMVRPREQPETYAPGIGGASPAGMAGAGSGTSKTSQGTDRPREELDALGSMPGVEDSGSLLMGGSAASDDAGNLAAASAYSSENGPYDADFSEEGVDLTYHDPTDREVDVPLDEGIPNLGEPVDIEDIGPETAAEEAIVEEVESGVPEEYGEADLIDSVEYGDAWIADAPGEEDEIPAASRGLRAYGEGSEDEEEIEDTDDTEFLGLYDDIEPSGAGGEVDLENDEESQEAEEGFSIVEDPDEPLSDDAGGLMIDPLSPEETLGLRDSESLETSADDSNLGLTGDYDEAAATQRLQAAPGEADTVGDAGPERQASFATGDRSHEGVNDTGIDRVVEDQEFGETGEFGAPTLENAGPPTETETSGGDVDSSGGEEHLGVSGNFDEAGDTERVPAEPADGEGTSEGSEQDAYVTGDDAGAQETSAAQDQAGYSAAWSTSSGLMGEWPNQEDAPHGFPGEHPETTDTGVGDAEQIASDVSDTTGGKSAGESGQITSQAKDRGNVPMTASNDASPGDRSGGDITDMAAASAGDLRAPTPVAGEMRRQGERDAFPVNPQSGGAEDAATSNAPENDESALRKSRKQRRMEAMSWVPAGAVKGDGSPNCPVEYPIKGNANSRIYHRPEDPSYASTIPEYCFATEDDAKHAGFRAPKG